MIGIKIEGVEEFAVYDGSTELESDGTLNGYVLYRIHSEGEGSKVYAIDADGLEFKLFQTTTDSTVYDVDAEALRKDGVISIGTSLEDQGDFLKVTENYFGTQEYVLKLKSEDLTGKIVALATYVNEDDDVPFGTTELDGYIEDGYFYARTSQNIKDWMYSGSDDFYFKCWVQEEGYIETDAALGKILEGRAKRIHDYFYYQLEAYNPVTPGRVIF
ncbi:hypothetical protein [Fibrobacter sp.]|uniref:hypothetical protein n=1 Tax=Fibrobacter sp. TaxID=35828 RepID=UPI00388FCDFE